MCEPWDGNSYDLSCITQREIKNVIATMQTISAGVVQIRPMEEGWLERSGAG